MIEKLKINFLFYENNDDLDRESWIVEEKSLIFHFLKLKENRS